MTGSAIRHKERKAERRCLQHPACLPDRPPATRADPPGACRNFPSDFRLTRFGPLTSLRAPSPRAAFTAPRHRGISVPSHEDIFCKAEGRRAQVACDRCQGQILGQVAVEAARLLRGKHKPIFTPHIDTGDFVVVDQCRPRSASPATRKPTRSTPASPATSAARRWKPRAAVRKRRPELLVEHAVKGMIPHNRLGRAQYTKLKVYAGAEHPHEAQQPAAVSEHRLNRSDFISHDRQASQRHRPPQERRRPRLRSPKAPDRSRSTAGPSRTTFPTADSRTRCSAVPARQTLVNKFDVNVNAAGGGIHGQAGAMRLAIARALTMVDPELRKLLKPHGMLTPRPAHEGTQEARPARRPQALPVLQALSCPGLSPEAASRSGVRLSQVADGKWAMGDGDRRREMGDGRREMAMRVLADGRPTDSFPLLIPPLTRFPRHA